MRSGLVELVIVGVWLASGEVVALADCDDGPPSAREIVVASCRVLDPTKESAPLAYDGMTFGDPQEFLERYYRGALITDETGITYVYPSKEEDVCASFPPGAAVRKVAGFTCCDTGEWGKCLYGGRWLWDIEGEPLNTFQ